MGHFIFTFFPKSAKIAFDIQLVFISIRPADSVTMEKVSFLGAESTYKCRTNTGKPKTGQDTFLICPTRYGALWTFMLNFTFYMYVSTSFDNCKKVSFSDFRTGTLGNGYLTEESIITGNGTIIKGSIDIEKGNINHGETSTGW